MTRAKDMSDFGPSASAGAVLEQFMSPCDGSEITVRSGTYTVETVSALMENPDTTYRAITGSTIDYTPPTGTQTVIYTFSWTLSFDDDNNGNTHVRLYLDNDSGTLTEVTNARTTYAADDEFMARHTFVWPFHIGGSDNDANGRRDTWTTARTIQMQSRVFSINHESMNHASKYWDGSVADTFSMPVIGITALA